MAGSATSTFPIQTHPTNRTAASLNSTVRRQGENHRNPKAQPKRQALTGKFRDQWTPGKNDPYAQRFANSHSYPILDQRQSEPRTPLVACTCCPSPLG